MKVRSKPRPRQRRQSDRGEPTRWRGSVGIPSVPQSSQRHRRLRGRRRPPHRPTAFEAAPLAGTGQQDGDEPVELARSADGWLAPIVAARRVVRVDDQRRSETGDGVDRRLRALVGRLALVDREALEQPATRLGREHVADQRRLARSRDAGDDREGALAERDVHGSEASAQSFDPDGVGGAHRARAWRAADVVEANTAGRRAAVQELSAGWSTAGPRSMIQSAAADEVGLVLDHDDGAAGGGEPVEHGDQPRQVGGVQPVVGSSSRTRSPALARVSWRARRTRWASPPERLGDGCPSFT